MTLFCLRISTAHDSLMLVSAKPSGLVSSSKYRFFVCLLPMWNSNPLLVLQINASLFYCRGVPLLRIERAKRNASLSQPVVPFVFCFELWLSNKIQQNTAQDTWHFLKVKNDAVVCEIAVTTLISATKPGKCASFSKKPGYRDFVVNTGKRHAQEIFRETAT